ncbi:MAG: DHH family phosphoesterase, partial [Clostridia bacterium]|nr:DHH family phosphoesterase [Clostridia bacterium]
MNRKKWIVNKCDKDLAANIAENCGVDPFVAYLLVARGFTDEFLVESFLYDTDICDPFTLPDMEKACERIKSAIDACEKITIFGDYDADGVTSTALLYSYLSKVGANVDYYIPDRAGEGYGMNVSAIETLKERGTKLVITVDNGISAIEEIEKAKELGIDVVVTDHHQAGEVLPDAVAVVDPHRKDCELDFREWAGVGVAFKLVSALASCDVYDLLEDYGDILAIGTIADIVSLKGENRILVRAGLAVLNEALINGTLRKGLKALIDESGATKNMTSMNAAFRIAPRINAAGRMGSAERAIKLLLTDDNDEATLLAAEI